MPVRKSNSELFAGPLGDSNRLFGCTSTTITEWLFDNAPAFDKHLVRAQYTMESLSSFCGIFLVVSGLLKLFFLKFIGHSMVDSIQISSVKISILGLQSLGSHGESTEPHRYLIRVSQGT